MAMEYLTEDKKLRYPHFPHWKPNECYEIEHILGKKGYDVECVRRIGSDRKGHDALQVNRSDVPRLVEQFFRQRIICEYQAEGHGKAGIIFVYEYPIDSILYAFTKFHKNKNNGVC